MELLLLAIPIILATITASVASPRGGNRFLWFLFGFFFPVIALILALLVLGAKCPACANPIPNNVRTCPSCNADLAWQGVNPTVDNQADATKSLVSVLSGTLHTEPSLLGRTVQTLDDALLVYERCDFNSAIVSHLPKGTGVHLESIEEIDGRQWIKAVLANGDRGCILAASVRSHTV